MWHSGSGTLPHPRTPLLAARHYIMRFKNQLASYTTSIGVITQYLMYYVYQQCITVSKRKNCFVDSTCSASQIDETQYIYVLRLCSLWYVLCSLWYVGTGLEGGSPFLVKQYVARRRHTTRKIPRCYYFSLHTIQFNRK